MLLRFCWLAALALALGASALSLSASALSLSAAPVPKHLMPKEEPYLFPTTVGAKHVSNFQGEELVDVVSKVDKTEGGFVVEVEHVGANGKRAHSQTVVVTARGLKVTHYAGKQLTDPVVLVVLPHTENNTWTDKWAGQVRAYRTAGWEEIEVPAGKLRALRVDRDQTGGNVPESSFWYAPGMGCVKWYNSSAKVGRELKSFTPGK